MGDFEEWEKTSFRCIAGVALLLFLYSVHMLTVRINVPLSVLALVNLAIGYVNALYSVKRHIDSNSAAAHAADALQACIAPGFIVVAFELVYQLHLRRRAKFMCISFDQGDLHNVRARVALWGVRLLALGLAAIGIMVNFELVGDEDDHDDDNDTEGHAGFLSVDNHSSLLHALAIVPIVFVLLIAALVTIEALQYGNSAALSVTGAGTWAVVAFGTAALIAGEFFERNWYLVASNLGRLAFAISLIVVAHSASRDIAEMDTFEDFLAKSRSSAYLSSSGARGARGLRGHHDEEFASEEEEEEAVGGRGPHVLRSSPLRTLKSRGESEDGPVASIIRRGDDFTL